MAFKLNSDYAKDFGARLAKQRLQRNITQSELAKKAGVNANTIRKLEKSGEGSISTLLALLRVFNAIEDFAGLLREIPFEGINLFEEKPAQKRVRARKKKYENKS